MNIFSNAQWRIKDGHVETLGEPYDYHFSIDRVFETSDHRGAPVYDWPPHMAEKSWVDVRLFNEVFEKALRYQAEQTGAAIDEEMLQRSLDEAWRIERMRG